MNTAVMFSSERDDWETPQALFDELDTEFHFTLDVCANESNSKCTRYFSPETDGLHRDWSNDVCWMNPPYGRAIGKWVEKAYREACRGALVVGLLPARTDTKWFHDFIYHKAQIRFLRGRLKFSGAIYSAPFPSMIVIWEPEEE